MLNFLVETKKEYIQILYSNIYKKIYEGFVKINEDISKNTEIDENDKLKYFQKLLSTIPKWTDENKQREYNRIFGNNKMLQDLVKALVKANIIILTYSPFREKNIPINQSLYMNVDLIDFNFKIHIECARQFYNNPLLFYQKYDAATILKNQSSAYDLIKKSIEEALRKILPIEFILDSYLDETPIQNAPVGKKYSIIENNELNQNMLNKIPNNEINDVKNHFINPKQLLNNQLGGDIQENNQFVNNIQDNNQFGNNIQDNNQFGNNQIGNNIKDNNQIGGSIQEILNRNNIKISDTQTNIIEELTNNHNSIKKKSEVNESIDSKIKKILEKDLKETDLDISLSYKPEESENYQEVFSNSTNQSKKNTKSEINDSMNTVDKEELKKKNKFFNNYLSF